MEELYQLTEHDRVLYCRKKKGTITFVSDDERIFLRVGCTRNNCDNELILEECLFVTDWSYAAALQPAFTEWIRGILDTCFTMAFYCFPQCCTLTIPYVWNLVYSLHSQEPGVAWSLGTDSISCASLPPLRANIEECEEVPVSWYPTEASPSLERVVLIYT